MTDRVPCLVPFCRCTIARTRLDCSHDEWICPKHCRGVSISAKTRRRIVRGRGRRVARAIRRRTAGLVLTQLERQRLDRSALIVARAEGRAWRRCKTEALEAAGGIG